MKRAYTLILFAAFFLCCLMARAQPVASVTISETTGASNICAGGQTTFTALPTNGGNSPTYQWFVNGALITGVTGAIYSTTALPTGSPNVYCVMASNLTGVAGSPATSDTLNLTVKPRPTATISGADTICNGNSAYLTLNLTNGTSWQVIVSNGVQHDTITAFATPWNYYLMPTATSAYIITCVSGNGCAALPGGISGTGLVVVNPIPVTLITPLDSVQCFTRNNFNFSSTHSTVSSGYIAQWNWTFGSLSPDTASGPSPTIHFTDTGTNQLVTLIETTDKGCINYTSIKVSVKPSPSAAFSVSDTAICLGNAIRVMAAANSGNTNTWYWSSTSDTICNCDTLYHTYTTINDKRVRLSVTNTAGCTDTASKLIHIHAIPQAACTIADTAQCFNGNIFAFTDHSTITNTQQYADSIINYEWNFGDQGTLSNSISPAHSYTNNLKQVYTVTEHITTNFGCTDSTKKYLTVFHSPSVNIINSIGRDTICTVTEFALSAMNNALQPKYIWSTHDSTISISRIIDTAAIFIYTVTVTDQANNKCLDSAEKIIRSVANPVTPIINNGLTPTACNNSVVHFAVTNIESGDNYFWYTKPALPISGQTYPNCNITFDSVNPALVYVVATNVWGCVAGSHDTIAVQNTTAPTANITLIADAIDTTLIAIAIPYTAITYQWGYNGAGYTATSINGATAQSLLLDSGQNSANYWVIITDTTTQCATKIYVTAPVTTTGIKDMNGIDATVKVYPNPTADRFNVSIECTVTQNWAIDILDINGRLIEHKQTDTGKNILWEINAMAWAKGAYLIRITSASGDMKVLKLIRE